MHAIFADTPETHAWFEALAKVSETEKAQITIPDTDTWRSWLEYIEVPQEDIEEVIATTPNSESDPELYEILQRGAAKLVGLTGQIEQPVRMASLADVNDPQYRYFYVQLLAACLPAVKEYHRSRGIPETISQSTLADIGRNIRVHRKREGVGGLGVMWWLMLHVRGMIYQLGRLQFEIQHASPQIVESMRAAGHEVEEPVNVLSIHIPDFMGPMDHDACTTSIQQAAEFFLTYYPDWPVEFAVCNSWLLDPQLKDTLKPTSNIVRFQDRFTIAEGTYDASESVMLFVFGKHVRDIDTIHPQSSLERGVISHLQGGRSWHGRQGWFQLSEPHRD